MFAILLILLLLLLLLILFIVGIRCLIFNTMQLKNLFHDVYLFIFMLRATQAFCCFMYFDGGIVKIQLICS